MKKSLSFMLAVSIMLSVSLTGCDQQPEDKNTTPATTQTTQVSIKETPISSFQYAVNDEKNIAGIMQYIGQEKDVVIPQQIEGYPVVYISYNAFSKSDIASVTIPDSVETIMDGAFALCQNLHTVHFGSNITTIGERAFYKCVKLKEAILPPKLTEIDHEAFVECEALEKVFIPKTLSEWGLSAFFADHSLTSITFEDGLEEIGGNATFQGALKLKDVTIPASVKKICDTAFSACSSLESVRFLGDAPEEIGFYAFGAPNASPDLKIYYPENASGWDTTPLKDEYTLVAY